MKIRYDAETDSLYIELLEKPGADVAIVGEDVRVDIDETGRAVGIDIDNASKYYDVGKLETTGISSVHLAVPDAHAAR